MTRSALLWLIFAQAVHLLSLLPWLRMVGFIKAAFAAPGAPGLVWPEMAIALALVYPVLLLGFSIATWLYCAKREAQLAIIFASLPLFFSLPMSAYGLVVLLGAR